MNWMQNTLDDINKELRQTQDAQELRIRENGSLENFNGWRITQQEYEKIKHLASATSHYKDLRGVSGKVMKFARRLYADKHANKFKTLNVNVDEIMSYIDHSQYWETNNRTIEGVKLVFAENTDMKCVICYFRNKFILTTFSSFGYIQLEIAKEIREGSYQGKLQQLPKKRNVNRYEPNPDDFRQPWIDNTLDMDNYTF